ncbi:hypothetical protein D3D01_18925 [Haloarcula sp. Atlit-7R]|nr:hypothetical protein D3D01_18925 [Haloarcula sp. Atlit-7R]
MPRRNFLTSDSSVIFCNHIIPGLGQTVENLCRSTDIHPKIARIISGYSYAKANWIQNAFGMFMRKIYELLSHMFKN